MSEYERLKKQHDEIILRQARTMAAKIVDDIMITNTGMKAERIVLVDHNNHYVGVGWKRDSLIDRIAAQLSTK